jgi:FPC/CPF motif-containing protein YcgG
MKQSRSSLFPWHPRSPEGLEHALKSYVADPSFPCVGAKSALAKGRLEIVGCRDLTSAWDDVRIHDELLRFAKAYQQDPGLFRSLAIVFEGPDNLSEDEFEQALWQRIQSISDKDVWRGQSYDGRVSSDPDSPHFSLSFGGEAFFIVGLHPRASRPARRFDRPTMVFNLHDQFETLREAGKYEGMREKIMTRDEALAGSRNPMLARHGEASEARQYSGRMVDEAWRCPFNYSGDDA